VLLEHKYRVQFFDSARKIIGDWDSLSRCVNGVLGSKISGWNLSIWRKGKQYSRYKGMWVDAPAPLEVIATLSETLVKHDKKFSFGEIEKHVLFLQSHGNSTPIWHPRFPISLRNPHTAAVIGHVLHDGHLEKRNLRVVYCNKERENISHFKRSVEVMLGTKIKFGEVSDKDGNIVVYCPNILGYFLVLFGLQPGNKVENNVAPPLGLMKCQESLLRSYLRALATDEASPHLVSDFGGRIWVGLASRSRTKPSKLIKADWEMFRRIGIKAGPIRLARVRLTKHGEVSAQWFFVIWGRKNFEIFKRKIGFVSKRKRDILDKILNRYRFSTDYVMFQENFRKELFQHAIDYVGGVDNYCLWLASKFGRRIRPATVYDWISGRHSLPLEVAIATMELLNEKVGAKFSPAEVYTNLIIYRPYNNSKEAISQGEFTGLVGRLGFKIL